MIQYSVLGLISIGAISGAIYLSKYKSCLFPILKSLIQSKTIDNTVILKEKILKIPCRDSFVYLPFDVSKETDMLLLQVCGIEEDGSEVDLTQLPGIPYLFSPKDIGFDSILVRGLERDFLYQGDSILGYCEEAM